MKKFWYGVLTVCIVFIVSCYEVNEEIVINENGSGTYVTNIDMSALVQMMQTMAGEEELSKNGLDRAIDTLINMKDVMDSAKDLSADQKRLYADGTMKLQLNIKENLFKTDIKLPFKNYGDLKSLLSGSGTAGMSSAFKKVFSGGDTAQSAAPVQDQGLDQINNVFDINVDKHVLSRKLNKEKFDQLMQKPEMAQAKQMMSGGFEILYTTTIKLPRPVKKVDNTSLVKLSADKRTVTIRYDMLKLFDNPENFGYTIEY